MDGARSIRPCERLPVSDHLPHSVSPDVPDLPASHPRRDPRRAWAQIGAALAVLIFALQFILPQPFETIPLPEWTAAPLALIAGIGLPLPFVVLWVNRARWRMMLRAKRWRVVAAFLMAGFTPVAYWGGLPSVIGFWTALGVTTTLQSEFVNVDLLGVFLVVTPVLVAYPLACGLIYGLEKRWRIAGFVAFNLGQLALVAALGLIYPARLY